jgi:nitrogen fixation protein NifU and related proteins
MSGNGDIYTETIIDHYNNPRKRGRLAGANAFARLNNPSCGDVIEVRLKIGGKGRIEKARFEGAGCAISTAAASMLMEALEGKTEKEVLSIRPGEAKRMLGIDIGPARLHCALLPLDAAKQAILRRKRKK